MLKRSETVGLCGSSDCRPILIPRKRRLSAKERLADWMFPKRENEEEPTDRDRRT